MSNTTLTVTETSVGLVAQDHSSFRVQTSTMTLTTEHGMVDEKGRTVGGKAYITDHGADYATHQTRCYAWGPRAGQMEQAFKARFSVAVVPTRNGQSFGSSSSDLDTNSLAEAEAFVTKAFAVQAKRYAKKYTK